MGERIDLAGSWTLRQSGNGEAIPIRIPGDNISALLEAGKIVDPYCGANELAALWVGREDWALTREVVVAPGFLAGRRPWLHMESVDTCAEIRINGRPVAASANMFRPARVDLEGCLSEGSNRIEVYIRSAEREAERINTGLRYPIPHSPYPVQSPHRNLVRKVQCHSGWDWGPCLMVSGIYGQAYIAATETGRLEYVHTRQGRRRRDWELEVTVEYTAWREAEIPVIVSIAGQTQSGSERVREGANVLRRVLRIRDPELWWPAGCGAQPLYALGVQAGEERVEKTIGFRTLEVVQADDEHGRSLVFRVNGRDVFCKGANWIPVDALPARQTPERYEALLSAAAAAHMNMLRVWGGGQYEADLFYRLCDEKGILVWQDFMFSCATYPATPAFLAEAEAEARHQLKRLKDHPSIALWCGNNEDLGALTWFPASRESRDRYLVDYDRLNEGVIGRVVKEVDPDRTWWPSSPCAGEGDYSDNWHDDARGDMHFWSVWHEGKSFESYYEVTPRFCSEFGFQSFPSLETVRTYAAEDQWNVTAPVMEHHQRHPRGNTVIIETMTRYFRLPDGFESYLYLSQVQQALAIKTAVEYWRSRRPVCMGVLYWQLNDVWPVASWSSIEYPGRWKLLHHLARRFFAPVHIAAVCPDGRTVRVVGINDRVERVRGELAVRFLDFSGGVRREERGAVELAPESAAALAEYRLDGLPFGREEAFLYLELGAEGGVIANELFLAPPKRCALEKPDIRAVVRASGRPGGPLAVELATDRPAFYVTLEAEGARGRFEDNGFTLVPGAARTVRFLPEGEVPLESFRGSLAIRHLRGTYR
jgi:beta-mannosidase